MRKPTDVGRVQRTKLEKMKENEREEKRERREGQDYYLFFTPLYFFTKPLSRQYVIHKKKIRGGDT